MKRLLLIVVLALPFITATQIAAKEFGTVHLYGYLRRDWAPFANVELITVKPGLVRFKNGSQEIEHSGRFSIEQVSAEKKWWQFGGSGEEVSLVILYDFMRLGMAPFREPKVFEKREAFVIFEVGGKRYTHCGRYSIQREKPNMQRTERTGARREREVVREVIARSVLSIRCYL